MVPSGPVPGPSGTSFAGGELVFAPLRPLLSARLGLSAAHPAAAAC